MLLLHAYNRQTDAYRARMTTHKYNIFPKSNEDVYRLMSFTETTWMI